MELSRLGKVTHGTIGSMVNLSDSRAFVIQLSDKTDEVARLPAGRIEHVESGLRTRFSSREEMWAFITRILAREADREEEGQ
jgi:hypothetical protein